LADAYAVLRDAKGLEVFSESDALKEKALHSNFLPNSFLLQHSEHSVSLLWEDRCTPF
jgi:hypothetical protein